MKESKVGPIHLRDWGGPGLPVLLTHGMAAHTHWWDLVAPLWRSTLHAVALDFRGHGESDWAADGVYTREVWLEDIENARRAMGWERFLLCGHSLGARLALDYAERNPSHLHGVVAVDFLPEVRHDKSNRFSRARGRPQPYYASEEDAAARFRLEPGGTVLDEDAVRALGRRSVRRREEGWTWKFDWRCLQYRIPPVWPQLPLIRRPALLVRGELSTILSHKDFARVTHSLPAARGLEISGAHHHVPLDSPRALAAAVASFAADLPA